MKLNPINRRDFLKLLGISPLVFLDHANFPYELSSKNLQTSLPNILILVFDALSARNMHLYGYPRSNTTNIERLSKKSNIYLHHYASGNFTSPGTTSLLTGVYPWTHRAIHMRGQALNRFSKQNIFGLLPDDYFKFAYTQNPFVYSILYQERHQINHLVKISELALLSNSYADKWLSRDFFVANEGELVTLKNEYDPPSSLFLSILDKYHSKKQTEKTNGEYRDIFPRGVPNCRSGKPGLQCFTLERTFDWLRQYIKNQPNPYLGYVHVFPPHAPYNPSKEFINYFHDEWEPPEKPQHYFSEGYKQKALNRSRRQYDEYIAYLDAEFGKLLDGLELDGSLENTILVVTSDHGEMLERGILGHTTPVLYEPIIKIPLLILKPGQTQSKVIEQPTNAVDLLPTLLSIAGNPIPSWCEGAILPGFDSLTTRLRAEVYFL